MLFQAREAGLLHTNSLCSHLYLFSCRLSLLHSRFGLSFRHRQLLICNFFFFVHSDLCYLLRGACLHLSRFSATFIRLFPTALASLQSLPEARLLNLHLAVFFRQDGWEVSLSGEGVLSRFPVIHHLAWEEYIQAE